MNPDQQNVPQVDETELKMPEGTVTTKPHKSPLTITIIVLLVLILIAILAGLYLWASSLMNTETIPVEVTRPTIEENNEPESTTAEARTATTQVVSTSDEIDAIEADLESTLFPDLESDFNSIESELNSTAN